jgi:uncharacterized protein DUF4349
MEDPEMRQFLRRSGARACARLLLPLTIGMVVAACAGSSASTPGAAAGPAGYPAAVPAASAGSRDETAGGGTGGSGGNGSAPGAPVDDAKIVRTGSLQLTVANVDTALQSGRDTVRGFGGYVGASQEQRDGDQLVATITYRIPVARWEDTLDALGKLGTVIGEQTQASEVTGQLVDLDARIRNLKASEAALVGYAQNAPKVSDLLEIEARLTDTRGQIEQLSAQQASLSDQVALATLTVTYGTEVVAVTQAAAHWDPAAEVDRASATLIGVVQNVISVLIVLAIVWLPILITIGAIVAFGLLVARRLGWRRPPLRTFEPPAGPPAPAPEG